MYDFFRISQLLQNLSQPNFTLIAIHCNNGNGVRTYVRTVLTQLYDFWWSGGVASFFMGMRMNFSPNIYVRTYRYVVMVIFQWYLSEILHTRKVVLYCNVREIRQIISTVLDRNVEHNEEILMGLTGTGTILAPYGTWSYNFAILLLYSKILYSSKKDCTGTVLIIY